MDHLHGERLAHAMLRGCIDVCLVANVIQPIHFDKADVCHFLGYLGRGAVDDLVMLERWVLELTDLAGHKRHVSDAQFVW